MCFQLKLDYIEFSYIKSMLAAQVQLFKIQPVPHSNLELRSTLDTCYMCVKKLS